MRFGKISNVCVKVVMVLMLVLSVLITGCMGNDEEEWKKARKDALNAYNNLASTYTKLSYDLVDYSVDQAGKVQKDNYYKLQAMVPPVEEKMIKAEKLAKGNQEREKAIGVTRKMFEDCKRKIISTGKINPLVPDSDLHFNVKATKETKSNKTTTENKMEKKKDVEVKKDSEVKKQSAVENDNKTLGEITGTEVRFRQEGSLNGKVLGYFDKGEKVIILSKENGWTKVKRKDGTVGYVSNDFCK